MTIQINPGLGTGSRTGSSQTQPPARPQTLGQQDFLTLLTAQLRNQDPLKPLENTEFLGQMAQFSTVAGIDRINDTLASQGGGGARDMRISMAATMLGHSVLVPGAVARPDASGAIRGAVELDGPVEALNITWLDAESGQVLNSQQMGPRSGGLVGFEWTAIPADIVAARRPVLVSIDAIQGGQMRNLDPQVYARVLSARASAGGEDVTLDIEDFGQLSTLEIESFR